MRFGAAFRAQLAIVLICLVPSCAMAAAADVEDAPVRYRVEVDAPRALADLLRGTLDIVRWQDYEGTTASVLESLMREAKEQATEAAAAEGYFNPTVDVVLESSGTGDARRTVRVRVVPGQPVLIDDVRIDVNGPAADDAGKGRDAVVAIRRDWSLRKGDRFRQVEWDRAKTRSVATLAASPYAAARMTDSEARIDPRSASAALRVTLESGPAFHFGDIQAQGLSAYDAALIRNFSTITPGELYTTERLDQYVRRLQGSGYFASVQARIDADPALADAAPIQVSVIEAPRHRVEGGIAYSTDHQIRADGRYTNVNFDGHATQFEVSGRLDFDIQTIGFRFTRPPNASHYIDSLRGEAERTDISGLRTRTALVGVHRQNLEERNRTGYALTYYEDVQEPQGLPSEHSRALYAAYERTWRNVDVLIAPTEGYVLNAEVGAAPLATRVFGRAIAQFAYWLPAGRNNGLFFRLEGGAVLASSREGIPSALLFRTGGDTTVRGYAFESLGVQRGDATIGGRYYVAGSAEATHYFTEQFGAAVFVDAGNAADTVASLHPVFGYGVGVRMKSPIGPFRLDVAYGQESHSVRLHMSVGITF